MSHRDDLLARLRAHAAAHPSDVQTIAYTVREMAEIDAYQALAALARKWRRANDVLRRERKIRERQARAETRAIIHAMMVRTLRGIPLAPVPEEPFPLVRRVTPPPESGVRQRRWFDPGDWFVRQRTVVRPSTQR